MSVPQAVSNRESSAREVRAEKVRTKILSAPPLSWFSEKQNRILNTLAGRALRATHATSAAIGLMHHDAIVCRAIAGQPITKVGEPVNSETGLTGLAIKRQMSQWCNDTES